MRKLGCKVNALNPSTEEIHGKGSQIIALEVLYETVAATGVTPTIADLGKTKLSRTSALGQNISDPVSSVRADAFQLLNNYLAGLASETFTSGGTVETGFNIMFDILPHLKPGIANGIMLNGGDELEFETEKLDSDVFDTCDIKVYQHISKIAKAMYNVIYHQIPYDASTAGEKTVGKNLAYLLIFPPAAGWTTEPTLILVKDEGVESQRFESWNDLIQSTKRRGNMSITPTAGVIDISEGGVQRDELTNRSVVEMIGGAGTCQLVKVNIEFTPQDNQRVELVAQGAETQMQARLISQGSGTKESAELAAEIATPGFTSKAIAKSASVNERAMIEVQKASARIG